MDSACARNCAFCKLRILSTFARCVDLLDCRVLGVGVVLHHEVEEVSATVVATEGQDISEVDILPERRADALGDFVGSGTFGMRPDSSSPAKARTQGSKPNARIRCHNEESCDVRALTLEQGCWNEVD